MKCQHCGAAVVDGAAFCQSCGEPLSGAADTPGKERFVAATRRKPDSDREETLWEGHFSKMAMIGYWVGAAAVTIAILVVALMWQFSGRAWGISLAIVAALWIVLALRLFYLQYTVRYQLTNQRLLHERGLLWRQIDRIETIDIDDVTFQQGPIERMFGVGSLRVISSDRSTPEFYIVGIEDVRNVATTIDNARRAERRKRGVHIEAV
jgi:membrane protein YdbS with pleckstrin-like domain